MNNSTLNKICSMVLVIPATYVTICTCNLVGNVYSTVENISSLSEQINNSLPADQLKEILENIKKISKKVNDSISPEQLKKILENIEQISGKVNDSISPEQLREILENIEQISGKVNDSISPEQLGEILENINGMLKKVNNGEIGKVLPVVATANATLNTVRSVTSVSMPLIILSIIFRTLGLC